MVHRAVGPGSLEPKEGKKTWSLLEGTAVWKDLAGEGENEDRP